MSSRSLKTRIAAGALALTLVLTLFVAIRFAAEPTQTERLGLNFPSIARLPLVVLPFLPELLEP